MISFQMPFLFVLSAFSVIGCTEKEATEFQGETQETGEPLDPIEDGDTGMSSSEPAAEPSQEPSGEPASEPSNEDTGLASDGVINIIPSYGEGGVWGPGEIGRTALGSDIRIPVTYDPGTLASPVIWLFNEQINEWAHTDPDGVIVVDLREYNDIPAIIDKINESMALLEDNYNVDQGRYYFAGWSAGGNIAVILSSMNQSLVAGTMVFPGTGGNQALSEMQANQGHKIRLFYACGDQDPNYPWDAVAYEANYWSTLGYQTTFVRVAGGPHKLLESEYGIRAQAWAWIRGFNMSN